MIVLAEPTFCSHLFFTSKRFLCSVHWEGTQLSIAKKFVFMLNVHSAVTVSRRSKRTLYALMLIKTQEFGFHPCDFWENSNYL